MVIGSIVTIIILIIWGKNSAFFSYAHSTELSKREGSDKEYFNYNVVIAPETYERLFYFARAYALSSCITTGELKVNKTLVDGACPERINFCHDDTINPTIHRTRVELILEAQEGELGTGYLAVDHEKGVVILGFRSSTTQQDWYSDFEIYATDYQPVSIDDYEELVATGKIPPCKDCKMHRGFHRFTDTLSSKYLARMIAILQYFPEYRIVVTGHSMGAAMATIAGIELRLKGYEVTVLTYAPPRMFNRNMSKWVDEIFETATLHEKFLKSGKVTFEKGYIRVVHIEDYIPMLPPQYHVSGIELLINKVDLPHEIENIEYRGPSNQILNSQGWRKKFKQELLHTKQHTTHFIEFNTCDNF